jgi:hypothetical protein
MASFCGVVRAIALVLGTVCLWLAPIYCYMLLRNVRRQREGPASEPAAA